MRVGGLARETLRVDPVKILTAVLLLGLRLEHRDHILRGGSELWPAARPGDLYGAPAERLGHRDLSCRDAQATNFCDSIREGDVPGEDGPAAAIVPPLDERHEARRADPARKLRKREDVENRRQQVGDRDEA